MNKNRSAEFVNSVFEKSWWLDTVAPNSWKEIVIEDKNQIIARWPIVEIDKSIGMPKLTQTLGFLISEESLHEDFYNKERKKITNLLLNQLPENKKINISLDPSNDYFLPFFWRHFSIHPHISYRLNDLTDLDTIYSNFHKIVKKNIKSANNKVTVKTSDDIEILLMLLDKTFHRQKMRNPWSKDLIRKIYKAGIEHNASHLLYAEDNEGNVHSGNLFLFCEKVYYNLISGTDPIYRSSGAGTLLLWEGIKRASEVSRSFDFEGSMLEGIENYYRQFGGTQIVYYEIFKRKISKGEMYSFKMRKFVKDIVKTIIGYNNRFK